MESQGTLQKILNIFGKRNYNNNCIFCKICKGEAPSDMLYQDDEIVIFRDISPIAKHHYLAVPKVHIKNAKSLTIDNKTLVEKLVNDGKRILCENDANMDDVLMGFHWPPFNSVNHLHLHIISPASEIGLIHRQMFKPSNIWFVTVDYVLEILQNKL